MAMDERFWFHFSLSIERMTELLIPIIVMECLMPAGRLRPAVRRLCLGCLTFLIMVVILWNKDTSLSFSCVVITTITILLCGCFYGGSWKTRFPICLLGGLFLVLIDGLLLPVFAMIFGVTTKQVFTTPSILPLWSLIELVYGQIVRLCLTRWKKHQTMTGSYVALSLFLPAVVIMVDSTVLLMNRHSMHLGYSVAISCALIVAVAVHFILMGQLNRQITLNQQYALQASLDQERADALLESYTTQRRLTHEFTNHLEALRLILDQGNLEEARSYVGKVSKQVSAATNVVNTHNPLMDSLLSRKYEQAAAQGVVLNFDLSDLRDQPLENSDLVIVISNLLNNAIEAASQATSPEIYVRARLSGQEMILSVRNRVKEDVVIPADGLPASTKLEPGHGMGLLNVCEVLSRYQAEYTISCTDNWFRFTCAVPVGQTRTPPYSPQKAAMPRGVWQG